MGGGEEKKLKKKSFTPYDSSQGFDGAGPITRRRVPDPHTRRWTLRCRKGSRVEPGALVSSPPSLLCCNRDRRGGGVVWPAHRRCPDQPSQAQVRRCPLPSAHASVRDGTVNQQTATDRADSTLTGGTAVRGSTSPVFSLGNSGTPPLPPRLDHLSIRQIFAQ